MKIRLTRAPIPRRIPQTYLIPSHGADGCGCSHAAPSNATTHHDAGIGRVVDQVIRDFVATALPSKNSRRGPVQFANVMDPVVNDLVLSIHVLGARPITGQQYADAS